MCVMRSLVSTWFPCELLSRATRTSYDHKRDLQIHKPNTISPTHKRTEGRAPVWGVGL